MLDYINDLAKPERARVLEALDQVEQQDLTVIRVQFRQIEGKLWEIKIVGASSVLCDHRW